MFKPVALDDPGSSHLVLSSACCNRAPCSEYSAAGFACVDFLLLKNFDNVGLDLKRQVMLANFWVGFVLELLRFHAQLTTKLSRSPSRTIHRSELGKRERLHCIVSKLFSEWLWLWSTGPLLLLQM